MPYVTQQGAAGASSPLALSDWCTFQKINRAKCWKRDSKRWSARNCASGLYVQFVGGLEGAEIDSTSVLKIFGGCCSPKLLVSALSKGSEGAETSAVSLLSTECRCTLFKLKCLCPSSVIGLPFALYCNCIAYCIILLMHVSWEKYIWILCHSILHCRTCWYSWGYLIVGKNHSWHFSIYMHSDLTMEQKNGMLTKVFSSCSTDFRIIHKLFYG